LYSQQSIDALRAEVERLQSSYDQLYVHAESSYQARNEAEAEAEALRKALSYALWQHNGGGSPIHNHWSAVAANTLVEIDAARKGAGTDVRYTVTAKGREMLGARNGG